MSAPLAIRPATAADLDDLIGLYAHLSPEDPPCPPDRARDIFARFATFGDSAILLGHLGAGLVSSCTLIVVPNLTRGGRPYALIENVVTQTALRRQGFGKAMLDAACDRAWALGCYKVMLMTGSTRPATLRFYETAGFAQTKTGFQKRAAGV